MAASQVLCSPELLHSIFYYCRDSRSTLAAAACVNSAWSEEALNVLWGNRDFGENPPVHEGRVLIDLSTGRRQYYASKIRMLHIEHRADVVHASLKDLNFPRLQHLLLNRNYTSGAIGDAPSQYLQPNLEGLEWYSWDSDLTKEFLDQINARCTRLKELTLGDDDNLRTTPEEFFDFLAKNRSISELTIACPDLVQNDLMFYLSERKGLECLALWDRPWDEDIFQKISSEQPHPFDDLRDITLCLKPPAIPFALPLLKNITRINLEIEGDGGAAPEHLATMISLQDMCIRFCDATELPVDGLLAMRSLTNLIRFCFMGHELQSHFSNDNLKSLLSALRQLETFDFPVQCPLSFSALLSISKNCRSIGAITLRGAYDLQRLAEEAEPMFPELQVLVIKGDGSEEIPPRRLDATEIARLICCHAPKLDDLELTDPRLQDVVEAYD
ncbi:hypothetical protein D6C90_00002 [Aureobasidium pullulans]|uniref:F-box domain-containing protein n=1 Tax=Aureobasidium pullulans TaxID=5580 RepID=A0A4S9VPY4_AURPU|nr:hypothetical protein D6C90_00002 [Aureobasidium pullulans]